MSRCSSHSAMKALHGWCVRSMFHRLLSCAVSLALSFPECCRYDGSYDSLEFLAVHREVGSGRCVCVFGGGGGGGGGCVGRCVRRCVGGAALLLGAAGVGSVAVVNAFESVGCVGGAGAAAALSLWRCAGAAVAAMVGSLLAGTPPPRGFQLERGALWRSPITRPQQWVPGNRMATCMRATATGCPAC